MTVAASIPPAGYLAQALLALHRSVSQDSSRLPFSSGSGRASRIESPESALSRRCRFDPARCPRRFGGIGVRD